MNLALRTALVTCASLPDLEADDTPLVDRLRARGHQVQPAIWNDRTIDWNNFDVVLLRCPTDYVQHLDSFLAWAAQCDTLANDYQTVKWNSNKRYLRFLAEVGIPVVPSTWIGPDASLPLPTQDFVLKPSVGVDSQGVRRFAPTDLEQANRHLQQLRTDGQTDVLLQPYFDSVVDQGEVSVVHLGGTYSHAVQRLGFSPTERQDFRACAPTAEVLELANRVADHVAQLLGTPVYSRVDILFSGAGPVVNEVELVDPVLHFGLSPQAADRLITVIEHVFRA